MGLTFACADHVQKNMGSWKEPGFIIGEIKHESLVFQKNIICKAQLLLCFRFTNIILRSMESFPSNAWSQLVIPVRENQRWQNGWHVNLRWTSLNSCVALGTNWREAPDKFFVHKSTSNRAERWIVPGIICVSRYCLAAAPSLDLARLIRFRASSGN